MLRRGLRFAALPSADDTESIARRMTQHHARVRNDVGTGCTAATLSIAELLATPDSLRGHARLSFLGIIGVRDAGEQLLK